MSCNTFAITERVVYNCMQLDLSPRGKLLVLLRHFGGDADPPTCPQLAETADPIGEWHFLLKAVE